MFIIPVESSNKDTDKIKASKKNSKLISAKKLSGEYCTLTAVHVANSLLMQESSSDTTVFPYVDMRYVSKLGLTDKLPGWMECCNKLRLEDV
jgi:hypothetical protein